tara:strand:- start:305 stop:592 length:288 start_codon:yes stop_codon:yes gene_type:complete
MPNEEDEGKPLSVTHLGTDQATAVLGVLASAHLSQYRVCTFYVSLDGTIAVAPAGEITLDALPEPMAVRELTDRGYTEEQLIEYLKGRDARLGRH